MSTRQTIAILAGLAATSTLMLALACILLSHWVDMRTPTPQQEATVTAQQLMAVRTEPIFTPPPGGMELKRLERPRQKVGLDRCCDPTVVTVLYTSSMTIEQTADWYLRSYGETYELREDSGLYSQFGFHGVILAPPKKEGFESTVAVYVDPVKGRSNIHGTSGIDDGARLPKNTKSLVLIVRRGVQR